MNRLTIDGVEYSWVETPVQNSNIVQTAKPYFPKLIRDERQADKLAVEQRIRQVELYLVDIFGVPMKEYQLIEVCGKVNLVMFTPRTQKDPLLPLVYPFKSKGVDFDMKIAHNIKRLVTQIDTVSQESLERNMEYFSWGYWTKQVKSAGNTLLDMLSDQLSNDEYQKYYTWLSDIIVNTKGY